MGRLARLWTPDGRAIVYLSLGGTVPEVAWPRVLARVRRIPLNGDEPEILTAEPRAFGSVFYLRDGPLGWTVIEGGSGSAFTTLIEIMSPQGEVATVRSLKGYADRMIPSPIPGHYVYLHTDDTPGVSSTFNSGIIVTSDGVVVVDALSSDAIARQVREAISGITAQPVRFLVSSTFHGRFTGGNAVYRDAFNIGHENYRTDHRHKSSPGMEMAARRIYKGLTVGLD